MVRVDSDGGSVGDFNHSVGSLGSVDGEELGRFQNFAPEVLEDLLRNEQAFDPQPVIPRAIEQALDGGLLRQSRADLDMISFEPLKNGDIAYGHIDPTSGVVHASVQFTPEARAGLGNNGACPVCRAKMGAGENIRYEFYHIIA